MIGQVTSSIKSKRRNLPTPSYQLRPTDSVFDRHVYESYSSSSGGVNFVRVKSPTPLRVSRSIVGILSCSEPWRSFSSMAT